jgi:hypothetical protein
MAIRRVLENDKITDLEASLLATFVAFQYIRTPKFISQMKYTLTYLARKHSVPIEDFGDDNFYKKAFIENFYKFNSEDMENFFKQNPVVLSGRDLDVLIMKIGIQIANYIQIVFFRKNLTILQVKEPKHFFITDHPVVIFNLDNESFVDTKLWEVYDNVFVFLPLSPTTAIYYSTRDINNPYDLAYQLSLTNMYESVYSNKERADIKSTLKEFSHYIINTPRKR